MKQLLSVLTVALLMTFSSTILGQSIQLNDDQSILKLDAPNKGILIPRMTASQKLAISNAVKGLIVYQTDGEKGIYQFNGTQWVMAGYNPEPYIPANGIGMNGDALNIQIENQSAGDMFYYDGSEWIRIPKGLEGQKLCIVNGVPTWVN